MSDTTVSDRTVHALHPAWKLAKTPIPAPLAERMGLSPDRWRRLARAVLDHDRRAFDDAFRATGMVGSSKFDFEAQYAQLRHLYAPLDGGRYTFTPEYVAATMEFAKPGNPNLRRLAMPPEWLWTNRLHFGLYSVLAALRATGDFRAAYERVLAAPWEPVRPG
jgi:hypothetical protein